ncbi:MAG: hypothetical protein ACRETL_09160, partial [Gammaproteobacteria bacterium]
MFVEASAADQRPFCGAQERISAVVCGPNLGKTLSERIKGSESESASSLRLSTSGRIMPAHMAPTTPAPKRKASIEDLEELGVRATKVIDEARRLSLEPEN